MSKLYVYIKAIELLSNQKPKTSKSRTRLSQSSSSASDTKQSRKPKKRSRKKSSTGMCAYTHSERWNADRRAFGSIWRWNFENDIESMHSKFLFWDSCACVVLKTVQSKACESQALQFYNRTATVTTSRSTPLKENGTALCPPTVPECDRRQQP